MRPDPQPLRSDFSAVPTDDALHDGEADAGARELPIVVQTLEWCEQFVGVGPVGTCTINSNVISGLPVVFSDADFYPWLGVIAGRLPCIINEILQEHLRLLPVPFDFNSFWIENSILRSGSELSSSSVNETTRELKFTVSHVISLLAARDSLSISSMTVTCLGQNFSKCKIDNP